MDLQELARTYPQSAAESAKVGGSPVNNATPGALSESEWLVVLDVVDVTLGEWLQGLTEDGARIREGRAAFMEAVNRRLTSMGSVVLEELSTRCAAAKRCPALRCPHPPPAPPSSLILNSAYGILLVCALALVVLLVVKRGGTRRT